MIPPIVSALVDLVRELLIILWALKLSPKWIGSFTLAF